MRILLVGALLLIPASAPAEVRIVTAPALEKPTPFTSNTCRRPTREYAREGGAYRGRPARPKRLTELPPAETYAAVYRLVDGCEIPLLYREVRSFRP